MAQVEKTPLYTLGSEINKLERKKLEKKLEKEFQKPKSCR
jgi:hypothetical protein